MLRKKICSLAKGGREDNSKENFLGMYLGRGSTFVVELGWCYVGYGLVLIVRV